MEGGGLAFSDLKYLYLYTNFFATSPLPPPLGGRRGRGREELMRLEELEESPSKARGILLLSHLPAII